MSAYIDDDSGNNENGEVRPMMTGSFHFRVCSKCSVNWVLIQNKAGHTVSVAVCDKCNETTSLSEPYVKIKCKDKSSLSENHVEGGTVYTCTSNNYPHANIKDERNSETRLSTSGEHNISDNQHDNNNNDDDANDVQLMECAFVKSMSTLHNIHSIPASQAMYKHSCIYLMSTESNVNYMNEITSESVAEDCQKMECIDAAEIARITMISDEIIVERKVFESALAKTSDDDSISSEKTINGGLLGIPDTLENVQNIESLAFLRPAKYTILQSKEVNRTVGERSLPHKKEIFCKIDDDPFKDRPSDDHVSQTNTKDQYPDAMLNGTTPNLRSFQHAFQHVCWFCFQQFADRLEMIKHKQLHKPDPKESCGICQKVFDTELLLREHYGSKHRDRSSQLITCHFCPCTTNNTSDFICHVRMHTGVKPYVCTLCDKKFANPRVLRKHIKFIHSKIFKYMCSECGKGCRGKTNLKTHKRVYRSGKEMSVSKERQQTVCSFCFQQLADRMGMMKHKQLHKLDPKEKCGICRKVFDTELLLGEHSRAEHRDRSSRLFTCNFCPYTSENASNFIRHVRLHNGVKPYVCAQCDRRFVNSGVLREHIKFIHSKIFRYVCSECGKGYRDKIKLESHKKVHHAGERMSVSTELQETRSAFQHVCSFCFQQFADRMEMMKHSELHTPNPNERCGICRKIFDTELLLREHYKSKHRDRFSQLITCNFCPYTTNNASNFICHVRMHTGVKPYVCTLCDKKFAHPGVLRKHIKFIHSKIFKYVCSECGKGCKDKTNLKTHNGVHHSGEQMSVSIELQQTVCSFCFQQFADRMEMMKHKQLHTPDPNESCSICQKDFGTESLLREHYRAEHCDRSSRLFTCIFCLYTIKNASEFIRHVRMHTGVKPYVCTLCDRRFVKSGYLREHIKIIHSKISKYVCSECGKGCGGETNLKTHNGIHHSGEQMSVSIELQQTVCSFCFQQFADRMEMMKHKQLHKRNG